MMMAGLHTTRHSSIKGTKLFTLFQPNPSTQDPASIICCHMTNYSIIPIPLVHLESEPSITLAPHIGVARIYDCGSWCLDYSLSSYYYLRIVVLISYFKLLNIFQLQSGGSWTPGPLWLGRWPPHLCIVNRYFARLHCNDARSGRGQYNTPFNYPCISEPDLRRYNEARLNPK